MYIEMDEDDDRYSIRDYEFASEWYPICVYYTIYLLLSI